ncbi:TonB family protein [Sulfuricurvum sp.]|uniref:energy transducer TonB n=1 Tax=Sulfuricurvum sp. TaxID=2025608 RepID=UPI00286E45BD|nr:TonB family protein [Sulfuricurvum sp.]
MRTANPFILSVGIHLALAALLIGALSAVQKIIPAVPEKTILKILLQPSESSVSIPRVQQPKVEPIEPKKPLVEQTRKVETLKPRVPTEIKPNIPAPSIVSKVEIPAPVVSKIPEAATVVIPKAPPPKVEENYEEENLGRIRTILAERLKYPKNALRLKQQGETTVTFTLGSNREVSQITISQSSGFELLDDAAKDLIESSATEFPKPKKSVRISVPIAYRLR